MREKVLETAKGWLGFNEADGSFKEIIDLYNSIVPLPVGYRVKYTDEWCATFVSAVFAKAGLLAIGFPECSCERMIALYRAAGRWQERDDHVPNVGDLIMYDWQDSGAGDAAGWADHVGIVAAVDGRNITIIEGNRNNAVGYRQIAVDARYIRGYCLPDYESVATTPQSPDGDSSQRRDEGIPPYGTGEPLKDAAIEWAKGKGLTDGGDAGEPITKRDLWAALRVIEGG